MGNYLASRKEVLFYLNMTTETCEVVEHPRTLPGQRWPRLQVGLNHRTQSGHDMYIGHLCTQVFLWTGR